MQNTLPEVGKTYISQTDPSFKIYVEKSGTIEAEDGEEPGFYVEGCAPEDKNNEGAIGYEFITEEWTEHGFTPCTTS